jgi:hypothetical protein
MKFEFLSTDFRRIPKYQISRKSVPWKPSCSMRTEGQTDTTIVAFINFANAPKNRSLWRLPLLSFFVTCLIKDAVNRSSYVESVTEDCARIGGMIATGHEWNALRATCQSATLSTTNLEQTGLVWTGASAMSGRWIQPARHGTVYRGNYSVCLVLQRMAPAGRAVCVTQLRREWRHQAFSSAVTLWSDLLSPCI